MIQRKTSLIWRSRLEALLTKSHRRHAENVIYKYYICLLVMQCGCCPRARVRTFGLAVERWTGVREVVGLRLGEVTTVIQCTMRSEVMIFVSFLYSRNLICKMKDNLKPTLSFTSCYNRQVFRAVDILLIFFIGLQNVCLF